MKNLIILFCMLQQIDGIENFLGKEIGFLQEKILLVQSDSNTGKDKSYLSYSALFFNNKKCRSFIVTTDSKNIINSISFGINESIDNDFYNTMIEKYGKPDKLYNISYIREETERNHYNYSSSIQKGVLKECTFEDYPKFIIWNKRDFILKIELNINSKESFISFNLS